METRRLGNTPLHVSLLCLGTMTWGQQNTEADAHEQLDYALAQGINFIDTAEMYPVPPRAETQGRTEAYIGTWLKARKNREQVILASKVAGPAARLAWIRGGTQRLDRKNIESALEDSLRRLQTDYLDLYQLHWPDRNTNYFGKLGYEHDPNDISVPIEETLAVLDDLVKSGKVRYIGLSNETPWGVMQFISTAEQAGYPRVVSIQNPYSLLNRSFEVGLAEVAIREQVGLLAYSTLGFGMLTGKYANGQQPEGTRLTQWGEYFTRYSSPQAVAATDAYVALARQHGLTPAQMALAFVNSRPFLTSNIIGATSLAQLKENIASAQITLSPEVIAGIEAIHRQYSNPAP
jgi:aryl-alcohol dehydrogenase-like predicted oxidoreductase